MSFLNGLAQFMGALMVLAFLGGVTLFVFTLVWMVRFVLLIVAVVALIMYAIKESLSGIFKRRDS